MKRKLSDVLDVCADSFYDEEEFLSWQKKAAPALKKIISTRLTARQRDVIMLYYYEGMRQKEIADKLGISASAVSHLKQRALKRLEYDLNLIRS